MPIPKRKKYERKNKFVSRCMKNKTIKKEYPQKQRVAICLRKSEK